MSFNVEHLFKSKDGWDRNNLNQLKKVELKKLIDYIKKQDQVKILKTQNKPELINDLLNYSKPFHNNNELIKKVDSFELFPIDDISKNKFKIVFYDNNGYRVKTIRFGASGSPDFTTHKDPSRKERYLARHNKRENWDNPLTAGALSRWILWNEESLIDSVNDYSKRFGFKFKFNEEMENLLKNE